jgi:AraC-like DNA-binding protein
MRTPLFSRTAGLEPMFALVSEERNSREAEALRRRCGFESVSLDPTVLIPFHSKNLLYNDAARCVGDPLIGFRVGLAAAETAHRPLVDLANAGKSLADVIARANAILAWQCNVCVGQLRRFGERVRWSLVYPDHHRETVLQHAAPPLILMLKMVLRHGRDAGEVVIECDGLPIAERHRAEAMLGVPVQPLVGDFAVTFPARWLETGTRTARSESVAPPPDYAERPLPNTLADAVQNVFEMHGDDFDFDVDRVCAELGTSRRMLQHGLLHEGVSYRDMLRRNRIARARRLLAGSNASIAEIAALAGYSDQANFHRAFVRVTGKTPGHYREVSHAA